MRTSFCPDTSFFPVNKTDGRTRGAKRFRAWVKSFSADFEGELKPEELVMVRQAAAMAMRCEDIQRDVQNGILVDAGELVRLSSEIRRLIVTLQAFVAVRSAKPKATLREYARGYDEPGRAS